MALQKHITPEAETLIRQAAVMIVTLSTLPGWSIMTAISEVTTKAQAIRRDLGVDKHGNKIGGKPNAGD